jgi:hypothetical protein
VNRTRQGVHRSDQPAFQSRARSSRCDAPELRAQLRRLRED